MTESNRGESKAKTGGIGGKRLIEKDGSKDALKDKGIDEAKDKVKDRPINNTAARRPLPKTSGQHRRLVKVEGRWTTVAAASMLPMLGAIPVRGCYVCGRSGGEGGQDGD